jgi:hypothetical protein
VPPDESKTDRILDQWQPRQAGEASISLHDALVAAKAASTALVADSQPVEPLRVPRSLCLPTGNTNDDLALLFRRQRTVMIGLVAAGCLLLAALFGLAMILGRIPLGAPNRNLLVALALACLAAAVVCFVLAAMGSGWLYRKSLRPRLDYYQVVANVPRPAFVEIEYPPLLTSTAEPTVSDVGYVVCAPQQRRIVVEGFLLRHIIRAEDVLDLREVETAAEMRLLRLEYLIDPQTRLIIGLAHDSIRADLMHRYFGRQALRDRIRQALDRAS